ncbi:MAG: SH3 domain-containing protein [Thiolinea sp.]
MKVESWDTLNMRSGPGVNNGVVAELPHNAQGVTMTGGQKAVGSTQWVEVSWKGKTGWVSKAYLAAQSSAPAASQTPQADNTVQLLEKNQSAPAQPAVQAEPPAPEPEKQIVKNKQSGMWILECGNISPFWKVEVLPEWIRGTLGKHVTGMPITHKRQEHGKYHKVALETEIRGANQWNRLQMTMRYTKSCYSRLAKRKTAFSVEGTFNNEPISGCCRAVQVP